MGMMRVYQSEPWNILEEPLVYKPNGVFVHEILAGKKTYYSGDYEFSIDVAISRTKESYVIACNADQKIGNHFHYRSNLCPLSETIDGAITFATQFEKTLL